MQRKIEIEIAIVGGEDERRIAFDAEILRGVGVARAGVGPGGCGLPYSIAIVA